MKFKKWLKGKDQITKLVAIHLHEKQGKSIEYIEKAYVNLPKHGQRMLLPVKNKNKLTLRNGGFN